MNSPFAPLSSNVSAVLIGLAIVAAGLIGFVIIWWIRNVLRHRLPKPFLGDGLNVEWAEQKRVEIAAGGFANDPEMINDDGHSDVTASDRGLETDSRGISIGGRGNHSYKDSPESLNKINEEDLLRSWLSDSAHTDDEWAKKLLGDRGPTKGS